ncbi:MAG: EpsI family protein [Candidatus Omnitrophica bacterium]|nr:EpsI family protein [Candidatus Omnitrophota bacterium]
MAQNKLLDAKAVRLLLFVAIAALVAFVLPKPKYQSLDVLKDITVPMQVGSWSGKDIKTDVQLMDAGYNFINSLFLREYRHPNGQILYLYLLDAGNFHNPKVCLTGAGFTIKEMEDIGLKVVAQGAPAGAADAAGSLVAPTVMMSKPDSQFLVTYWITINGRRVDWAEQKIKEFFFSLVGAKKAGLMVRIDTPATEELVPAAREGLKDFVATLSAALADKDRRLIFGR